MRPNAFVFIAALFAVSACNEKRTSPPKAAQPVEAEAAPASQPASKPGTPDEPSLYRGKKQTVSVRYVEPCAEGTPCQCEGVLSHGQNALAKIGVTEPMIAKGTPCVIGDLDANGFNDLVFMPAEPEKETAAVLMFDEGGLSATHRLPKPAKALIARREGNVDILFVDGSDELFIYRKGSFTLGMRPSKSK